MTTVTRGADPKVKKGFLDQPQFFSTGFIFFWHKQTVERFKRSKHHFCGRFCLLGSYMDAFEMDFAQVMRKGY
ncbi:hypothetical protein BW716_24780 [[Flexibacter] sp. ATCC 35208]|nr:hypothetical protein BW716_24780 [[Flexibacter] sp. ATCC 35208]